LLAGFWRYLLDTRLPEQDGSLTYAEFVRLLAAIDSNADAIAAQLPPASTSPASPTAAARLGSLDRSAPSLSSVPQN